MTYGTVVGGMSPEGHDQILVMEAPFTFYECNFQHGDNGIAERISLDLVGGARDLKFIGSSFFIVGDDHGIARRRGPDDWDRLHYKRSEDEFGNDFVSFDGFSEQDIYIGGFGNAFWHFDGRTLTRLDHGFPGGPWTSALDIRSVVCGGDGRVYLGGTQGELIAGSRETGWEELVPQQESSSIGDLRQMAWFRGQLYATTHSELFYYDQERRDWRVAFFDDEESPGSFGWISVRGERMLVAGGVGASVYDRVKWTRIWGTGEWA